MSSAGTPQQQGGAADAREPAAAMAVLRQLLVDMCTPIALDGLPFPVAARNHGWLARLDAVCAAAPALGAELDRVAGLEGPLAMVNIFNAVLRSSPNPKEVALATEGGPSHLLAVLRDCRDRQGAFIETTDALETLLLASDLDAQLPIGLFALPYPTQYVSFGAAARSRLQLSEDSSTQGWVPHGCYCVRSPRKTGGYALTLYVVMLTPNGRNMTLIYLSRPVDDPEASLKDWVAALAKLRPNAPNALHEGLSLVSFLAKVFLYLGLKEARVHKVSEYSELGSRVARVEAKKRGKLERRLTRAYDRIVVGPEHLPRELAERGVDGLAVSPHWRRGHFRMQVHGPANSLRKLIFVMPQLVGAHRLTGTETLAPRSYAAR